MQVNVKSGLQPSVIQTCTPPASITGTLVGFDTVHAPLVIHVAKAEPHVSSAQAIVDLSDAHIGRQVVLQFAIDCAERPIIMGVLRDRGTSVTEFRCAWQKQGSS